MNSNATWQPDPRLLERLHPSLRAHAVELPPLDVEMTPEQINAPFPNMKAWNRHLRTVLLEQLQPSTFEDTDAPARRDNEDNSASPDECGNRHRNSTETVS